MTFGEHLEDLRRSLGKAFLWLAIGLCIGLGFFANRVVRFVQEPLQAAILNFYADRELAIRGYDPQDEAMKPLRKFLIERKLMLETVYVIPQPSLAAARSASTADGDTAADGDTSDAPAPDEGLAGEEVETAVDNDASDGDAAAANTAATPPTDARPSDLATLLEGVPSLDRLQRQVQLRPAQAGLSSHKSEEGFMIWFKAGLVVGAVIASPMIFYHIWNFVAAGLYPHERKYVYLYLPISVTLFVSGVALAFFLVLHYVLNFLLTFNASMDVNIQPRLSYYMNFVLLLPLGFGIAFQLPLVMLFLQRIGIVETKAFIDSWRLAIFVIAIVSMVLTPADVTSMMAMMIPLCLLYGLGILMCKFIPRGRGLGSAAFDPA